LREAIKSAEGLGDIEDVRLSSRLVDSPATFVQKGEAISAQMRNFFKSIGQEAPPEQKVLEINGSHPLVKKISEAGDADDETVKDWAALLVGLASIADGEPVENGRDFTRTIEKLLERHSG
jgi:molecular chaperone HtpG